MRLPRFIHKFYAFVTGYFWLPCPNCGRMFGGHEKGGGTLWMGDGSGRMCCPRCTEDYGAFHDGLPDIARTPITFFIP